MNQDARTPDGAAGRLPSRRAVLKLMAASAALSLGPGCDRKPDRRIVSMADSPEYLHPGKALFYASTWTEGPVPYGMMVKAMDGRPIKVEGLPGHPLNSGTSSAAMQAAILSLYDPDRLRGPAKSAAPISWAGADSEVAAALRAAGSVVLITRATLGPSEREMVARFLQACPGEARHFVHETVHDAPRRRAWQEVYGADGEVRPRFQNARVILAAGADFLGTDGDLLAQTRGFAARRSAGAEGLLPDPLPRLYVAESAMTVTGSNADHRIPIRPSQMLPLLKAVIDFEGGRAGLEEAAAAIGCDAMVLRALAEDLYGAAGEALVLAGAHLPPAVHAAAALLNETLGASGKTLVWNPSPASLPVSDPGDIAAALEAGPDVVILLGVNPVYDWPGGGFDRLLARARFSAGHGLYLDETLASCTVALPSTHNLESWNDAAPIAGLLTLCQPLIAPLFDARQEAGSLLAWGKLVAPADEVLAPCADWHEFVRRRWEREVLSGGTEAQADWEAALPWEAALRRGGAAAALRNGGSAAAPGAALGESGTAGGASPTEQLALPELGPLPGLRREAARALVGRAETAAKDGLELVILPHHAVYDGRFANNAWLQELPDPVSKLVWDNVLAIGSATASRLGLAEGDLAAVDRGGRPVVFPVLIQTGTAADVAVVTLGHGRARGGETAAGKGVNAAPLLGRDAAPRLAAGISIERRGGAYELVRAQNTFDMHGRPIVIHGTAKEYAADAAFPVRRIHKVENKQLHGAFDYSEGHHWVMSIDLNACTGCGACVIACQAENNVPVVGKGECSLGREMAWIRIDRYEAGDPANPHVFQQPMACQHCDNAPCESVCPVNAAAHSDEGLNEQVYNRCVGTRYCANNCPYKVRRFNFYHYVKRNLKHSVQELAFNPHVTVRFRGVMEKCTFCVQRINAAKFQAKNLVQNQGVETIRDGAIMPACAQACPAGAIVFGDGNDLKSRVATLRASPLAYDVLGELNVKPCIAYLARVRNLHPGLAGPGQDASHGAAGKGGH